MIIEQKIFHVDVNSAYLSWSALKDLREDPDGTDLRTIPSAVGGDRESRHGVILAKSIPAKAFGIHTGEPVAAALRKCPGLVLVKPDFSFYRKCSEAFIGVLKKYAPVVEQVSIDEAFCDMTGTERLYGDAVAFADRIREEIRETLGFTVNVGVSDRRFLAKMASDFTKPDRTHTLFFREIREKMWPLPIGDLYGVGRRSGDKMAALQIKTIGDAARTDEAVLKQAFGMKFGWYIHRAANGLIDDEVTDERSEEKSYGNSTTLPEDLTAENAETLLPATLMALSEHVGARMRRDDCRGSTVSVTLRTFEFVNRSRQTSLVEPTDSTREIYETASELFRQLWDGRTPVRLIGVTVSGIVREVYEQMSLFSGGAEKERREKEKKLDRMTDQIRSAYGSGALVRGSLLNRKLAPSLKKSEDQTEERKE